MFGERVKDGEDLDRSFKWSVQEHGPNDTILSCMLLLLAYNVKGQYKT